MINSKGYAGFDATSPLKLYEFERRDIGPKDILIDIQYCGVCHSDIHTIRNEWKSAHYPLVPGHEIVGTVKQIGNEVTKHKVGDIVGVGCMVNACLQCECCKLHLEQFCEKGCTFTYNSTDADGSITQGGYANNIVVREKFVLKIPFHLSLPEVAPLLCAGITTYSPLRHWKISKNHKVGIIGLGGLGHMGVKLAHALGAKVTVFTSSPHKKEDALKLGANEVVISANQHDMQQQSNSFDFILDTVSAPHDLPTYMSLLKHDGTLCMVGASPTPFPLPTGAVIFGRKSLSGSLIGGIQETQEMLDFCGKHNITADIELISINQINEAYDRILQSDVKYRFVIDMKSLK